MKKNDEDVEFTITANQQRKTPPILLAGFF
jgi:hypothetical protein